MAALARNRLVLTKFSVVKSPWSNGTCEQMMHELVRTLNAMVQDDRRNTQD